MTSFIHKKPSIPLEENSFQDLLPQIYRSILSKFKKISKTYVFLHGLFILFFVLEISLFFSYFSILDNPSFLIASGLGCFFFTGFAYFLLSFYFQSKKPEQWLELKNEFLTSCRQNLSIPLGEASHHLSIAEALSQFATYLQDFEETFYRLPSFMHSWSNMVKNFSWYCYWEDIFHWQELLFQTAIEEHLLQIRITPTDLEVHASLANTYVALSKLYKHIFLEAKKKYRSMSEENFKKYSKLAIEEFQILNDYAPDDPWVHEQLAGAYKNLDMRKEELQEMELLLQLKPQDKETLFRLGLLYFQQGQNAKGLRVYETLKKHNYPQAIDLIASYGAHSALF